MIMKPVGNKVIRSLQETLKHAQTFNCLQIRGEPAAWMVAAIVALYYTLWGAGLLCPMFNGRSIMRRARLFGGTQRRNNRQLKQY